MKEVRQDKIVTHHKEEYNARKQTHAVDRAKIRDTLTTLISPLDTSSHPSCLVNIATGLLAPSNIKVDSSVTICTQQMEEYESGWPQNFRRVLNKRIITMVVSKKSIKINDTPIYNTDLVYTRVIGLQQSRDIDIKKVLTYELSPVPPALFDESGGMRIQAKAASKAKLQVEVSTRLTRSPDAIIIDGCALLWSVHWPVSGTVEDYSVNFMGIIGYHLIAGDVYLIFDRYLPGDTK